MKARLSALVFLFTVLSASLYFSLYCSFSLSDLVSITFLFRSFLSSIVSHVSAEIHSFLFLCLVPRQLSLARRYAECTWSHFLLTSSMPCGSCCCSRLDRV
ncbi:hypothetical protein EGW08_019546 [Elysia chlorotica]|uniref:Uncharacterized protein n=1 Tax=Elysia chlorotica TaxID=188477 RepID=A0A433STS6_ELYCH|nr:hypothetical protein EGW08_019546 [Elysia chlorotica]